MRDSSDTSDAQLTELLATLRVVQTREADFEERFLYDFHELVAREAVCCPARHRLFEHLMQMLANFGRRRLTYGASSLGIGLLAVGGYFMMPGENSSAAAAVANRMDSSLASLAPGLARDYDDCTHVKVEQKTDPMDRDQVLVVRGNAFPSAQNTYTSTSFREDSPWGETEPAESRLPEMFGAFPY